MKVAYFDCEFGAAGDMLVGALLDAGATLEYLQQELNKLDLPPNAFELRLERVVRCSISCSKFNVLTGPEKGYEDGLYPESSAVSVTPSGKNPVRVKWGRISQSTSATATLCPRTLHTIVTLLQSSSLPIEVVAMASRVFDVYFRAEAACQGFEVDDLQMNELMALDAIVDIVAFSLAYHELGISRSYVSSLPLGTGTYPYGDIFYSASAPATVQVLQKFQAPISPNKFHNECLTVTGAAILCSIASGWSIPAMKQLTGTGYGAGSYAPSSYPNACRVIVGDSSDNVKPVEYRKFSERGQSAVREQSEVQERSPEQGESLEGGNCVNRFKSETIVVIEANIDDLSPQSLAYAMERLFEAGALDVLILPALMKKGRSGHLLKVLSDKDSQVKIQEVMFAETSTIGVRFYEAQRIVAEREWRRVILDDGTAVRIKLALDLAGKIVHSQPEYDDCAAYARKHNIPLKSVLNDVMTRFANESH